MSKDVKELEVEVTQLSSKVDELEGRLQQIEGGNNGQINGPIYHCLPCVILCAPCVSVKCQAANATAAPPCAPCGYGGENSWGSPIADCAISVCSPCIVNFCSSYPYPGPIPACITSLCQTSLCQTSYCAACNCSPYGSPYAKCASAVFPDPVFYCASPCPVCLCSSGSPPFHPLCATSYCQTSYCQTCFHCTPCEPGPTPRCVTCSYGAHPTHKCDTCRTCDYGPPRPCATGNTIIPHPPYWF
jgi:DNA helicase MCM8